MREPDAVKMFKLGIEALMAFFGIVGNIGVCLVTSRHARMKTTMNLYIRNLAIADLGLLTVSFPLAIVRQELDTWPLGEFICKYIYPGSDIFYGVSVWTITVIAFERYRNIIVKRQRSKCSINTVYRRNAIIWFTAFVIQCVPLYIYMDYDRKTEICSVEFPSEAGKRVSTLSQVYTIAFLALLYVIPLVVISWTNIKISQRICQSSLFYKRMYKENKTEISESGLILFSRNCDNTSVVNTRSKMHKKEDILSFNSLRKEENKRLKQNKKARKILTPLVAVFAITMLPFHVVKVIATYCIELRTFPYYWVLFSVCGFLIVVNSCMNPLIYAMVSRDYRKAFKKLFQFNRRVKEQDH